MEQEIVISFAKQSIDNVSITELRRHPVWVRTDNPKNEREVAPWTNSHLFRYQGGECYVHSQFILQNHTEYEGYIRINMGLVTAIFILLGENEHVAHALRKDIRRVLNHSKERLAKLLELKVEEVFPFSYKCLGGFSDAKSLSGLVED
ncbi:MAG: hypothetical protein KC421_14790 [Anaerolineales bacterium]|nr:hypothetical protein [Anaerolineales bacterium]